MMISKVWGVYSQFEPTYKYQPELESIWSTQELAIKASKALEIFDHIWVSELIVDNTCMFPEVDNE